MPSIGRHGSEYVPVYKVDGLDRVLAEKGEVEDSERFSVKRPYTRTHRHAIGTLHGAGLAELSRTVHTSNK